MSSSAAGRKWINNGIESKQVKEVELSKYLATGWRLGQLKSHINNRWHNQEK